MDINHVFNDRESPLNHLCRNNSVEGIKLLFEYSQNNNLELDITIIDQFNNTPLGTAVTYGNCDIIELLLANGAYVDPVASNVTPIYLAAREGNDAALKILLDHNADVS